MLSFSVQQLQWKRAFKMFFLIISFSKLSLLSFLFENETIFLYFPLVWICFSYQYLGAPGTFNLNQFIQIILSLRW